MLPNISVYQCMSTNKFLRAESKRRKILSILIPTILLYTCTPFIICRLRLENCRKKKKKKDVEKNTTERNTFTKLFLFHQHECKFLILSFGVQFFFYSFLETRLGCSRINIKIHLFFVFLFFFLSVRR